MTLTRGSIFPMRLVLVAAFAGLLGLTGCASVPQAPASRGVAAAQQTLTLAYKVANEYALLPRCGSRGATVLCSEQVLLDEMVRKGREATAAIDSAKTNAALVDNAWASVLDFQAFVATRAVR